MLNCFGCCCCSKPEEVATPVAAAVGGRKEDGAGENDIVNQFLRRINASSIIFGWMMDQIGANLLSPLSRKMNDKFRSEISLFLFYQSRESIPHDPARASCSCP